MGLGKKGEDLACEFLRSRGYEVLEQNYRTRSGEVDIIARDNDVLVFLEVKTRENIEFGLPFEAVTSRKRRKIVSVALSYLKRYDELPYCRFDVLSICFSNGKAEFELIRDAFEVEPY